MFMRISTQYTHAAGHAAGAGAGGGCMLAEYGRKPGSKVNLEETWGD